MFKKIIFLSVSLLSSSAFAQGIFFPISQKEAQEYKGIELQNIPVYNEPEHDYIPETIPGVNPDENLVKFLNEVSINTLQNQASNLLQDTATADFEASAPQCSVSSPTQNACSIMGSNSCNVSSKFGSRESVTTTNGNSSSSCHKGVDISGNGKTGDPVYLPQGGKVTKVAYEANGYGNYVEVQFTENGHTYSQLFAHLDSSSLKVGQSLNSGDVVGTLGSTGNSTGPHLHFGLSQDGKFIDPSCFLGNSCMSCGDRSGSC